MPESPYKIELPAFTGRNVPIKEIAKAIGKDAQYVRVGIQKGILKFPGKEFKKFGNQTLIILRLIIITLVRINLILSYQRIGKDQMR